MKSKLGFHGMSGRKDVAHRSVGLVVIGGNTSWERVSVSEIMAVGGAGFYHCRREFAVSILLILTPQYSCSFLASFRLRKDSSIRTKVSVFWHAACRQRSRRGFLVSQNESTHPRVSSTLWIVTASDRRGVSYDSVTVWWLGRGLHKGRSILEQCAGPL